MGADGKTVYGEALYIVMLDLVSPVAERNAVAESPAFFEIEVERVVASDLEVDRQNLQRFINALGKKLNLKRSGKNKASRGYDYLQQIVE